MKKFLIGCLAVLLLSTCGRGGESVHSENEYVSDAQVNAMLPLYDSIDPRHPGDWLSWKKEKHVSFSEYLHDHPVKASAERNVIYIKPIGAFDTLQNGLMDIVSRYLSAVYHKKVRVLIPVQPDTFPVSAFRKNNGAIQLNTQFVMKKYLRPKLPHDAVVYIALTTVDLYPDENWNFVFGQSSLKGRVGIWSVNRLCVDTLSSAAAQCLKRTLKIAAHEVGHMFSITHCRSFHCIMNGSLTLEESDAKPAWFCPECLQKLCWNNGQQLTEHLQVMENFWQSVGDKQTAHFYHRNLAKLNSGRQNKPL